jgi:hypothetical protein
MEKENLRNMPLYEKAMEILKIVERLTNLIPEENKVLFEVSRNMYTDALQLAPKIAGAEGVDLYDIKMENAAVIRKCAREIYVQCNSFLIFGDDFKEAEYLDILRAEIEEFRVLFAEWVKTFDQWDYIIDRWGLFNPPGVNYDDPDPEDDLPFDNPFDDFEE